MDKIKVNEVIDFAENNYYCYRHLVTDYLGNLQKKKISGKYDRNLAVKLLEYFYSNYVRPEFKKRTEMGYDPKLNPEERKMFATHFRNYLEKEFLNKIKPKRK